MAPIRRYLRLTPHTVLEVRIYLENPSLADSWLLSTRTPVLPRIIDAVRPLILPKLREENENAKKKTGNKKKGRVTKDTISRDDFEVSIFLTETSVGHTLLTKRKEFGAKRARLGSNSSKMTGDMSLRKDKEKEKDDGLGNVRILIEDEDEEVVEIRDEEEDDNGNDDVEYTGRKRKRPREEDEEQDQKKKLAMKTNYEGFGIYGRILCLIIKKKGGKTKSTSLSNGGSDMLEKWVSTQADKEDVDFDGDI